MFTLRLIPRSGRPCRRGLWPYTCVALFAASNGAVGVELWQTKGTPESIVQIQDLAPGAASSNPEGFRASSSRVFFVADGGTTGAELWALDLANASPAKVTVYLPLAHS